MRILLGSFFLLFLAATANASEAVCTLTLIIPTSLNAPLYLALYADDATFLELDKAVMAQKFEKNDGNSYVLSGLKKGAYALAVYQDSNGNGELDSSFLGVPKEPYGFSTNPDATFGPPAYDACRFELSDDMTLEILLK